MDTLLRVDLSKLSQLQLLQLERQDHYIRGTYLRVLATTVDAHNREKCGAGIPQGKGRLHSRIQRPGIYQRPPTFQLPFLSREKKYRMFQLDGDSMLPIPDKSYVIGEFLQDWNEIKTETHIFTHQGDGIVFQSSFITRSGKRKHPAKVAEPGLSTL